MDQFWEAGPARAHRVKNPPVLTRNVATQRASVTPTEVTNGDLPTAVGVHARLDEGHIAIRIGWSQTAGAAIPITAFGKQTDTLYGLRLSAIGETPTRVTELSEGAVVNLPAVGNGIGPSSAARHADAAWRVKLHESG